MGVGASVSGTGGFHGTSQSAEALKQSVSAEISNAASVGTTTTLKTTCTPKDGETRAGLWQWVISSEDYGVAAYTPHTICRTGELAFTEPDCSFWDCKNADCSSCKKPSGKPSDNILANAEKAIYKDGASKDQDKDDDGEGEEA